MREIALSDVDLSEVPSKSLRSPIEVQSKSQSQSSLSLSGLYCPYLRYIERYRYSLYTLSTLYQIRRDSTEIFPLLDHRPVLVVVAILVVGAVVVVSAEA